MRKLTMVLTCLLMLVSMASAQTKMKGKTSWHCNAAAKQQMLDPGDQPGHSYGVAQGTCQATSSTMGEKSGMYTQTEEVKGDMENSWGSFVVTTDDGDKIYYTYQEKVDTKKNTGSNTWKITGGTGKHKGHTGSGSCTGKLNKDQTSDWTCSTGGGMKSDMKM